MTNLPLELPRGYREPHRQEIIGGKIVLMSPKPVMQHIQIARNIYDIFGRHLRGKNCEVFQDSVEVHLTEEDTFIPDVSVVCDKSKIKRDGIYGAPDLVVEVLSPSTAKRDKGYKKDVYEKCGVKEYWIVSVKELTIEVYWLVEGKFVLNNVYALYEDWVLERMTDEEKAEVVYKFGTLPFDDLIIDVEDVFRDLLE